jgi:hypothetical protein
MLPRQIKSIRCSAMGTSRVINAMQSQG